MLRVLLNNDFFERGCAWFRRCILLTLLVLSLPALADQTITVDLPAQPIDSALTNLADQAGVFLLYDSATLPTGEAAALNGRYTVAAAFEQVLAGTGLVAQLTGDQTVRLVQAPIQEQATAQQPLAPVQLEIVTVTGELQQRSLQDSQTSAVVISGEELDRSNDRDFYDVVRRTPGVTILAGGKGLAVRGINQNGFGGAAGGKGLTVRTTIDGAGLDTPQSTFFGPYSTWDLEQVEILRGPQSTQQGRNALAGSIVINTADPVIDEFQAKARAELGQRDTYGIAGAINIPLIEGKLAARIAAERSETDGHVQNITRGTDDHDGRELENYRLKLRFTPNDKLDAVISHNYTENYGGEDYVSFAEFPERRITTVDIEEPEGSDHSITSLKLNYALNSSWTLASTSTYYEHEQIRIEGTGGVGLEGNFDDESFTQEIKATYNGTERLRGAFGVYYTTVDNNGLTNVAIPAGSVIPQLAGVGAIINSRIANETETENMALFGEIDYDLTDKTTLTLGARFDRETVEFVDTSVATLNPPVFPLPVQNSDPVTGETTFNAFLPKIGIFYDWTDQFSTGFTIQRGYRAGGSQRNLLTLALNETDPEYTTNYEIATRYQSADRRTTFNSNVFYIDWTDMQVLVEGESGNPNDLNAENAGESSLYGIEADLQQQLTDNFSIYASAAVVKSKFDEFGEFTGNEFVSTAELSGTIGGTYYFGDNWLFSLDGNYISDIEGNNANDDIIRVPSYSLWNARLGYESDMFAAYLFARNLFDRDYYTNATFNTARTGIDRIRTGDPRYVGVQVSFEY